MATANSILSRTTYHAVYEPDVRDALRRARPGGFSGVQLAETPGLCFEQLNRDQVAEIASIVRGEGLRLSLHASDDDASLFTSTPVLRQAVLDYYRRLLDFAWHAGAKTITLHMGHAPTWPTDEQPPRLRYQRDSTAYARIFDENFSTVLDCCQLPCRIVVENLKLDDWHRELLQPYINDRRAGICWDLPKSYRPDQTPDAQEIAWIRRNAHRIGQVHLHDRRDGKNHRVIGTGCVDFPELLSFLPDVGVEEYVIEVRPFEQAVESLENLRKILQPFQAQID